MHIRVNNEWALLREEDVHASCILVELLREGEEPKCATFSILQSSDNGTTWESWTGKRLEEMVEDEIRKTLTYVYACVSKDANLALGRIIFPRLGIYIPKYVMLNELIGIAIDGRWDTEPDNFSSDSLKNLHGYNWLRLRVLEKRDAFLPVIGGREVAELDVDSPQFKKVVDIYFTFYHFRLKDGQREILTDKEVRELMPSLGMPIHLGELFIKETLSGESETFADPSLSIGSYLAVDKLNFCFDL